MTDNVLPSGDRDEPDAWRRAFEVDSPTLARLSLIKNLQEPGSEAWDRVDKFLREYAAHRSHAEPGR